MPEIRSRRAAVAVLAAWLGASTVFAADHPKLAQRLSAIFEKREYQPRNFGPAKWLEGAKVYTTVEPAASSAGAREIVSYDIESGRRDVLVPASKLLPPGATKPLAIEEYAWTKDRSRLLLFTNSKKVWRQNTRGDYWIVDVAAGSLRKLGGDAPESSLMFAKFSPDGSRVAYARGNDLWVEDVRTGAITRLTSDGSETTINGTTDWVYEEEFHLRDAFRWSPDGRSIAYWQFDDTGVGVFTLIDDTDSLYPSLHRYGYPKAGTKNPAVRIGVVSAAGGSTRWIDAPGDPRDDYIPRMEWAGGGDTVAFERVNRLQNRNDLYLADAKTGASRLLFRDESKTWVDINDEIRWWEKGHAFLFESERDGWRHVYRVPSDGSAPSLVTRSSADVVRVAAVDGDGGWLYFLASPDNATEHYLYRCRLDGKSAPERLTPVSQRGTHAYNVSPDRRWAFHTQSSFDHPPATELVRLPSHESRRVLVENSELEKKAADLLATRTEFVQVAVDDGVVLDGWVIKPSDFSPEKKYPFLVYVYGEIGQTVTNAWQGPRALFHRAIAEEGVIVASFDNRGTPAPKGAAWRKVVYGSLGVLSSKEQAAAVRSFASSRPWVDASRVAIWGWSGGGTSTLNAMFRYPDLYKVGVAVASVPDQTLYDSIYQERYMGLPGSNAEGYKNGSAIHHAEGLAGRLLIVHGSGDDNVHYQGAEKLVNRLVELGKRFDETVYPNRTHAISEGKGTSLHLHTLIARYILENLEVAPAPPKPQTATR
jgi:dipeptidyl-peptidase-4